MISTSWDGGQGNSNAPRFAPDSYEQQYAEDFPQQSVVCVYSYSTAFGLSCGGEECQLEGNASFGEFALNWP
jgi:hypothetical protein